MEGKSPAFQFYPKDFLADENVVLMTNQEVGCYVKLLSYCWIEGSIPKNIKLLSRMCGEKELDMVLMWERLSKCFCENGTSGRLINPRLQKERIKQELFKKVKSEAGKRGAKAKWGKAKNGTAINLPKAKNSSSSSSSSSDMSLLDKSNKLFVETSEEFRLADYLFSKIQKNNSKAKKPNIQVWAKQVDLMLRIDKRDPGDVQAVIDWCQDDNFWKVNILSTAKLREKFDQLYLKMTTARKGENDDEDENIRKWRENLDQRIREGKTKPGVP